MNALAWMVSGLLLALPALAPAQTLDTLQRQPEVPEAMNRDLQTLRGYYGQVARRSGSAPTVANERDPFQVTPELRVRQRSTRDSTGQALPAPALAPETTGGDGWQVQGLLVGSRPVAVLVRDRATDPGASGGPRARAGASTPQLRYVRPGDTLDMADGRSWRVMAIDRAGVLVRADGAETETLRIR